MVSAPAYLALLSGYDPLARGLFDRSPEQGAPRRGLISRTLKKLRAAGVVARGDCLWFQAAADATIARLNWLSSSYTLAAVNSPTFTADRGYTGDGASAYLTTGFLPSTAGGKFVQDSAALGVWVRTFSASANRGHGASDVAANSYSTIEFRTDGAMWGKTNGVSTSNVVYAGATSAAGLFVTERLGAASVRIVKNGVSQVTDVFASTANVPREMYLLARNSNGSGAGFSADQISMAYLGGALTDEQHVALYDIAREYLTAVGAI